MRRTSSWVIETAVIVALAIAMALPASASGRFRPYVVYPTAPGPMGVAVSDLNGDGRPDLVVVTGYSTVNVLLGNGDGTFQAHVSYPAGLAAQWIAAADVNSDGKMDVVTGNNGNWTAPSVSVLLGNSDGTLQYPVDYGVVYPPDGLVIGDFNGDGKLDIAVTGTDGYTKGRVSVLLGNGDGTFQKNRNFDAGDAHPGKIFALDLNRDGNLDLAFASGYGVMSMRGTGDGRFGAPSFYSITADSPDIGLGDFNGDGRWDVAGGGVWSAGGEVLLGDGKGGFPIDAGPFPAASWTEQIQVADYNGDGKDDIAVLTSGLRTGISLLLGNGDATFQTYVNYPAPEGERLLWTADLNLDGAPDLITDYFGDNGIAVLMNNGGTQLNLASSSNPSTLGDPVTFTLTLTPTFSDAGTPSGGVTFKDGSTVLGKVPLGSGTASLTTSTLTQGTHSITAIYSGDRRFNRHQSATLTQEVD